MVAIPELRTGIDLLIQYRRDASSPTSEVRDLFPQMQVYYDDLQKTQEQVISLLNALEESKSEVNNTWIVRKMLYEAQPVIRKLKKYTKQLNDSVNDFSTLKDLPKKKKDKAEAQVRERNLALVNAYPEVHTELLERLYGIRQELNKQLHLDTDESVIEPVVTRTTTKKGSNVPIKRRRSKNISALTQSAAIAKRTQQLAGKLTSTRAAASINKHLKINSYMDQNEEILLKTEKNKLRPKPGNDYKSISSTKDVGKYGYPGSAINSGGLDLEQHANPSTSSSILPSYNLQPMSQDSNFASAYLTGFTNSYNPHNMAPNTGYLPLNNIGLRPGLQSFAYDYGMQPQAPLTNTDSTMAQGRGFIISSFSNLAHGIGGQVSSFQNQGSGFQNVALGSSLYEPYSDISQFAPLSYITPSNRIPLLSLTSNNSSSPSCFPDSGQDIPSYMSSRASTISMAFGSESASISKPVSRSDRSAQSSHSHKAPTVHYGTFDNEPTQNSIAASKLQAIPGPAPVSGSKVMARTPLIDDPFFGLSKDSGNDLQTPASPVYPPVSPLKNPPLGILPKDDLLDFEYSKYPKTDPRNPDYWINYDDSDDEYQC